MDPAAYASTAEVSRTKALFSTRPPAPSMRGSGGGTAAGGGNLAHDAQVSLTDFGRDSGDAVQLGAVVRADPRPLGRLGGGVGTHGFALVGHAPECTTCRARSGSCALTGPRHVMKTVSQACTAAPTDIANSHGRTINRTTAPTATKGAGPARGPGRAAPEAGRVKNPNAGRTAARAVERHDCPSCGAPAGSPCHTRAKGWTGRLQVVWSFG
jgi:hypothetical protein